MHASSALVGIRSEPPLAIGLAGLRIPRGARLLPRSSGRTTMKNPLDSLWGTIICGLILTLILHNIVSYALGG